MKTEIYGTIGPKCQDEKTMAEMFENGMTGMRLNLSHTSLKESGTLIERFHHAAKKQGKEAVLLIDMQGPELRIGKLFKPLILQENDSIGLSEILEPNAIPIPAVVFAALEMGDELLMDDGRIELEVISAEPLTALVKRGGTLTSKKSIKVVEKDIKGPLLTKADYENIALAKEYGVKAVMQPFVRNGSELKELRSVLDQAGNQDIRIFAKIENMDGVHHLQSIMDYADMIVIARGDLGNDMPLYELPRIQKEISDQCLERNVPFLVVTQMLASMIHSPIPTRAEVSDIFHAISDGASAIMVTNETAAGDYPVEVIRYLTKTAASAEEYLKMKKS